MAEAGRSADAEAGSRYRVKPSVGAAIGVVAAYMVVVNGLQLASGIDYSEWFDTADNAYEAAVIPLAAGAVLLLALVAWFRWDFLWRDPARLPMTRFLWSVPILAVIAIVPRFFAIEWGEVPGDLLLAATLASVIVGFAEETVFRAFFLRGMRTNRRPEAWAALWTTVAFGVFHLGNAFLGQGAGALGQVFTAGLAGFAFYLFRRGFGFILSAMIVHGLWDFSLFLDAEYGDGVLHDLTTPIAGIIWILSLITIIVVVRRDRGVTLTPTGIEQTTTPT